MDNKPFSQACENNKRPILAVLTDAFSETDKVLEIGSGSGQHAVFFAKSLTHLTWQTSDLAENHAGINLWLDEQGRDNIKRPISVDLEQNWAQEDLNLQIDGLYSANTLHIISWPLVVNLFAGIAKNLPSNARVCLYGPFKYQGEFTSDSNADFDKWLKDKDSNSGIRDFEAIVALADSAALSLIKDHPMPANNRLLVFAKR